MVDRILFHLSLEEGLPVSCCEQGSTPLPLFLFLSFLFGGENLTWVAVLSVYYFSSTILFDLLFPFFSSCIFFISFPSLWLVFFFESEKKPLPRNHLNHKHFVHLCFKHSPGSFRGLGKASTSAPALFLGWGWGFSSGALCSLPDFSSVEPESEFNTKIIHIKIIKIYKILNSSLFD